MRIIAALFALACAPAFGSTYTVNSSGDFANPPAGTVTLRSAVAAADAAGGANLINVPTALGPYVLTQGALFFSNLASNVLQIQGTGGSAVIDGNRASGVFYISNGAVALTNLVVRHGSIPVTSQGAYGVCTGAGIFVGNGAKVNIASTIITDNQTTNGSGGGICAYGGTTTIVDSIVSNNEGWFGGGGIRIQDATVHVTNTTFSDNRASAASSSGGAITTQGTLTVAASTFSRNFSENGGAIYQGDTASTTLSNVTIAGNSAVNAGQVIVGGTTDLTIVSSIVANPVSGVNCSTFGSGKIVSGGHNLESANSCNFVSTGDLVNADPVLGPLQPNGGPNETMALLAGSKAIDAGANPLGLETDQRGLARIVGVAADIGAFEAQPAVVAGSALEYINRLDFPGSPGGHFFYTADPAEQAFVDGGGAGRFTRTGRSFNTGGYTRLCRFYGSVQPGPNSHFFTANEAECNSLKSLQVTPTPTTTQQWNYEGFGFDVTATIAPGGVTACPAGTIAVYRGYNNAFTARGRNPWDSNHRFSTVHADITTLATGSGWADEGIVFCALQ